jgi:2-methylcitrate dehydratase PrpD
MATAGVTAELVRRGLDVSFAALPDDVVALTGLCLLDYAGVTLAGVSDPSARILRDHEIGEGRGPCSLVGHPARLSASQAALVNGTAGHALDYDDVHMALPGHVSIAILPALLALAEARDKAPKDVIAAFVAGYETGCRIGLLVGPGHYARGFHATATVGSFAAALASAHLLRLDARQTEHALAIAGAQTAGFKAQFGTMCKPLHAGRAAQNGVTAALMAERGFEGALDILGAAQGFAQATSPDFHVDAALAPPPHGFHLYDNLFKFHASCYGTHGLIEAVRKLHSHDAGGAVDVVSIAIRVGAVNDKMCNIADPRTGTEAKFSMRLMGAYAFQQVDTARLDAFDEAQIADPRVRAMREKIVIVPEQSLTMTQAKVIATFADGRKISTEHDASVPERDIAKLAPRLHQKFMALAEPVQGTAAAKMLAENVERFAMLTDVAPVTKALTAA